MPGTYLTIYGSAFCGISSQRQKPQIYRSVSGAFFNKLEIAIDAKGGTHQRGFALSSGHPSERQQRCILNVAPIRLGYLN